MFSLTKLIKSSSYHSLSNIIFFRSFRKRTFQNSYRLIKKCYSQYITFLVLFLQKQKKFILTQIYNHFFSVEFTNLLNTNSKSSSLSRLLLLDNFYFSPISSFNNSIYSVTFGSLDKSIYYQLLKYIYFYSFLYGVIGSSTVRSVSLPSSKSIYTVLRSPHTDKKSREQFILLKNKNIAYLPSYFNVNSLSLITHVLNVNSFTKTVEFN